MNTSLRSILLSLLIALCSAAAACRYERPAMPDPTTIWREVDLGTMPVGSFMTAVDFGGGRGYALGFSVAKQGKAATDYVLFRRQPTGNWQRAQLVAPPNGAIFLDIAATASGVVAGGYLLRAVDAAMIYDERAAASSEFTQDGLGVLTVDGNDDLMVAGGAGPGGLLWTNRARGQWVVASIPLDAAHDGGIQDVFVGNGQVLACGFDDGADTLQVLLKMDDLDGSWRKIELPQEIFQKTLQCVAATTGGGILLGGISGAGGPSPRAFLWLRSAAGPWTELVLPNGDAIAGITDILPASDGSYYVTCGGEDETGLATILHGGAHGITREVDPFVGSILQLDEADDGSIFAAGYEITPGGHARLPLLFERRPTR